MKLYPIGIQNFEKLRREGYHYIDKTELIYRLVTTGNYYFLSRPRRFGKSLLISTLEAYFEGKKDLFDGLAIAGLEKAWQRHPVFHLDPNTHKYDMENSMEQIEEKQYALPYAADMRKVLRIGVNFSSATRNIERWLVE